MRTDSVSCHQTGVMAGILLFALKLTNLPSLLYQVNKTGALIDIIIICLVDILFIGLVVWLKLKHKNESLFKIISDLIGKFLTKLIYFVLLMFFIFKILSITSDGYIFIKDVVDEEFTMIKFIICFLPVICALAYSGIRSIGRTCEFFYPFIIIGLLLAIVFSFVPISFWGIGNIFQSEPITYLESFTKFSFWSGDLLALLIFMDKIEVKKGKVKQLFIPVVVMSIILVVTYLVYYSLYQETSIFHTNLIYDIVQYAMWTSTGWHMDIFAILVFMLSIFLQGGIFLFCAKECVAKIFNINQKTTTLSALVFLIMSVEFLYLRDFLKYVTFATDYLSYFTLVCVVLIPLLLTVSTIIKGKKGEKNA